MLSFNKLLLLALIVFGVWQGFKWLRRVEEIRRMHARDDARDGRDGRGSGERPRVRAEDMVQCRRCGTYVPTAGAAACGRSDCPYG